MLITSGPLAFDGFGPSRFYGRARRPEQIAVGAQRRTTRRRIRENCPAQPGVYGMLDETGELAYVGQSKRLRQRLQSYFSRAADGKAKRIAAAAARIVWETAPHELTAQLRELELIRRWRPRFNRRGMPDRRGRAYICLGRPPALYAYLAASPGRTAEKVFGPVRAGRRTQRALAIVNDLLQLRDCPEPVTMVFRDQAELFGELRQPRCLRYDLGACLGPCFGGCSRRQYAAHVRQAAALFDGDRTCYERLAAELAAASEARRYEQAAILRDKLLDLEYLSEELGRLRHARREFSFVYPITGVNGRARWYLIRGGDVRGVVSRPETAESAAKCLADFDSIYGPAAVLAETPEDTDVVQLVAGWFRSRPKELGRTVAVERAIEHC
ncbi:MAG TPA: GIY-YIG nuclease family protein, partial [Pirellulales bacterium]|nr:GIY-YIG nuclease family protein [Pirellulales bacterium]